jgi:hypothetical protein
MNEQSLSSIDTYVSLLSQHSFVTQHQQIPARENIHTLLTKLQTNTMPRERQ